MSASRHPRLSIVLPVVDEAQHIVTRLVALAPLRRRGVEVIVADGGSADATVALARPLADIVIAAPRGRGSQMHAGAQAAHGENLLFLHADTHLPEHADRRILGALSAYRWGRFDVSIEGSHRMLGLIGAMMNLRSRLSGIATGDQAMFMSRAAYEAAGGFPDIPLMEDIALSRSLRRGGRPACLRERVITSGRRWEQHGALRTVLLMWRLRAAYFLGADPARLARRYGYRPRPEH
ncbi:MAG: TIGR04283 family arsenosugar biosynthesis glycosyltransferase [Rhodocyclaceae bacterium]|nr:TIGR04283 family arsenosugar biosynthesis glycosyltransferase [Rhodocyclaceae bacterium]MCP5233054.1 TIGR04283 family arsenosugar biosynthesis glycosyltransferase [Zoogloeaceae bacterium]MCB1910961.1 TIGR04283 family arsenosugar biosynthesis glycosyltransferase [Rhodocyclaceae bacterium]MCP5239815.1 TIGR04283 family arsenosugar biosynthesis glycosyltransferase [Zoogloeaceae bacterium]MCP5253948.1 TIGR04283 family arsenosugar biosynthesis glycosyltransferase [Zoogloeaceae bacterium]